MKSSEKLACLADAYVTKKVDDEREEIVILNDELPAEAHKAILDIQFKLNEETGTFELDYEIMSSACDIVSGVELEELPKFDPYAQGYESASVYTAKRLSYITVNNQSEISDLMREYGPGMDIADCAAEWYERQVVIACELLRDWVLEEDEEAE